MQMCDICDPAMKQGFDRIEPLRFVVLILYNKLHIMDLRRTELTASTVVL